MSPLDAISKVLESTIDAQVQMGKAYYGSCNEQHLDEWNYYVFNRVKTAKASNKRDLQTEYRINIIHENYIPEGFVEKVINALESNAHGVTLRLTSDDITYAYTFKGNTDMVVEIASITMYVPQKRS